MTFLDKWIERGRPDDDTPHRDFVRGVYDECDREDREAADAITAEFFDERHGLLDHGDA